MKPILPLLLALLPIVALAQVPTADPTATRSATPWRRSPWHHRHRPLARNRRCCRRRSRRSRSDPPVRPGSRRRRCRSQQTRSMTAMAASFRACARTGPNRVFDSRTYRYYDSVPVGDGQQIKR